jgi:hypothetical protein
MSVIQEPDRSAREQTFIQSDRYRRARANLGK